MDNAASEALSEGLVWIGLDLGQDSTSLCAVDHWGTPLVEDAYPTSTAKLDEALSSFSASRIGLIAVEAGTQSYIVRGLRARGYPVAIFDSRKASRFLAIRRNKTDSSDAKGLADLGRLGRGTVSQVYLKSLECEQLRSRLGARQRLVCMRVTIRGMIRSRLVFHGRPIRNRRKHENFKQEITTQLTALRTEEGVDLRPELNPLLSVLQQLDQQLKRLNRVLKQSADAQPICRRFMEVPGVGPICALSFYSAIDNPERFSRTSDVAAYLGLVPRRYQSGATSRTFGITKSGSRLTRSHLVTAAIVFRTYAPEGALKDWVSALRQRVGPQRSNVALARKLAILLLTLWKNGAHFKPYPGRS